MHDFCLPQLQSPGHIWKTLTVGSTTDTPVHDFPHPRTGAYNLRLSLSCTALTRRVAPSLVGQALCSHYVIMNSKPCKIMQTDA